MATVPPKPLPYDPTPERLPRHVAIICDGNGRWAKKRHLPRALGHKKGVETVRNIVRAAGDFGLEALSLYAFSSENWKRPEDEISDLMGLLRAFIKSDIDEFTANDVRLKIIGNYKAFAPDIVDMIEDALARTAHNSRTTLAVALNYGSQDELVRAANAAATNGVITAETEHRFTAGRQPVLVGSLGAPAAPPDLSPLPAAERARVAKSVSLTRYYGLLGLDDFTLLFDANDRLLSSDLYPVN